MHGFVVALSCLVFGAWLVVAVLATAAVRHYRQSVRHPVVPSFTAPAVVIIPVRGADNVERLWTALCAQQFPKWRVVFAVESREDPAYPILNRLTAETPKPPGEVIVAGIATDTGQKIHNQLAALATLRPGDEIVVFADADIVPEPDWLARCVHALRDPSVDLASGLRFLVPEDDRLATAFVCAAHAAISTVPRARRWALAWGGTMALRRSTLDTLRIEQWWRGALLDDLQLTRAVWQRKGFVLGPSALLVRTPVSYSWREAFAFARRQYLLVRIHTPRYWLLAAAATSLPPLGWAATIAWSSAGYPEFLLCFGGAILLNQYRATLRKDIVGRFWDADKNARQYRLDRWATPAWLLFHAGLVWSAAFGHVIRWGGRVYRLDAPLHLTILSGPGKRDI